MAQKVKVSKTMVILRKYSKQKLPKSHSLTARLGVSVFSISYNRLLVLAYAKWCYRDFIRELKKLNKRLKVIFKIP